MPESLQFAITALHPRILFAQKTTGSPVWYLVAYDHDLAPGERMTHSQVPYFVDDTLWQQLVDYIIRFVPADSSKGSPAILAWGREGESPTSRTRRRGRGIRFL